MKLSLILNIPSKSFNSAIDKNLLIVHQTKIFQLFDRTNLSNEASLYQLLIGDDLTCKSWQKLV